MAQIYNSQLDAFELYHQHQEKSSSTSGLAGPALPALGHALAGSTGTAVSNLAIYPLDLIITRLQVQRQLRKSSSTPDEEEYKGVIDAFRKIYKDEGGLKAFYTGVVQDTGKSIADSFLFFLFYNYIRTNRLRKQGANTTSLPVFDELFVGALAGACSKFFTTPIANIVTRKQTASLLAARSSTALREPSVQDIYNAVKTEKGYQGFWSGYSASLVLTLNPSITFFLYETLKRLSRRDEPGARLTFLMAAISKAVASSITYPFSLAKARAQTGSNKPVDKDEAKDVKEEIVHVHSSDEAKKAGRDAKTFVKKSTVFATILEIYRAEGLAALYEGVWGEILKGFFSHGITMIVKESIHKLIIQTYYLILKALNKYPSPTELANQAGHAVQERYEVVSETVVEVWQNGKEAAGVAFESVGMAGSNATEAAKSAAGYGKDVAGVTAERVGVVGSNATEALKNAADYGRE